MKQIADVEENPIDIHEAIYCDSLIKSGCAFIAERKLGCSARRKFDLGEVNNADSVDINQIITGARQYNNSYTILVIKKSLWRAVGLKSVHRFYGF